MTASSCAAKTLRGFLWKSNTEMNPASQQACNLCRATSRSSSKVRSNLGWNKGCFINALNSLRIWWLSWSKTCFIFSTSNTGTAVDPQEDLNFSGDILLFDSAWSKISAFGTCLVDKYAHRHLFHKKINHYFLWCNYVLHKFGFVSLRHSFRKCNIPGEIGGCRNSSNFINSNQRYMAKSGQHFEYASCNFVSKMNDLNFFLDSLSKFVGLYN